MANVAFKKGLLANLPSTYSAGTFYVTTDERAMYLDISDSARIRLGDFQQFETVAALEANVNPSTEALYYVKDINCLAKWDGSKYVQINRDTGFTSFEITGEGNAITAVAVDETDARKLILTKGATYMTAADVDAKIGVLKIGEVEYETVKAYVDQKAADTLKAAQGGSSETAASVSQALETYKTDNDARVEGIEGDIDALQEASAKHVEKEEGKSLIADTEIARLAAMSDGANKVEASETNGNIKIDGVETVVYTHPEKHAIADVTGLQDALDGKQAVGDYATKTEAQAMADAKDEAIAAAKKSGDDAMAEAQKKVASVSAGNASVTVAGTSTAPTVAVKLDPAADNAIKLGENGLKVEIGAAPEYTIVKAENSGEYAAVYNLTKDGTIVGASINIPKDLVVKSGSVVGDEIVLVLNDEAATEIKIPVASLIEYVTSGSQAGDMVVVNVSDDHKVTATITDGTITLAKLATDVQTAIGKAHSHENADVLAGISADDVANWNGAQAAAEKTAADALAAAKEELEGDIADVDDKFADYTNTTDMNAAIKAVDDKFASYSTTEQMNAAIKTTDDKAVQAQNEVDALEGVVSEYKTANDAAVKANTDAIDAIEADYLKASDKEELAGDIAEKANSADVYAKTETYTQEEVDAAIADAVTSATEWVDF